MPGATQKDIDNEIAKRMKVNENITKKLVFTSGGFPESMEVTRYRDTGGKQYIRAKVRNGIVSFTSEAFGEKYEWAARELGEMLIRAADNPCGISTDRKMVEVVPLRTDDILHLKARNERRKR
jgi:hypothetical protein